jgi:hypothetical protein
VGTNWDGLDSGDNDATQLADANEPAYVNEATSTITSNCGHVDFDGVSDYLNFPGLSNDDFTHIALIYLDDGSGTRTIASGLASSAAQFLIDNGEHIEIKKSQVGFVGDSTGTMAATTVTAVAIRSDDAGDATDPDEAAGRFLYYFCTASPCSSTPDVGGDTNPQTFTSDINVLGASAGPTEYFEGNIIAFVSYTDAETSTNIAAVMDYLVDLCE